MEFDTIPYNAQLKKIALKWASQRFNTLCFLDNNNAHSFLYAPGQSLLGAGSTASITIQPGRINAFKALSHFLYQHHGKWIFGFLTYDLKNSIENLRSKNWDGIQMPDLHFFVPSHVFQFLPNEIKIFAAPGEHQKVTKELYELLFSAPPLVQEQPLGIELQPRTGRADYLDTIHHIRSIIREGVVYEVNFCQEFFAQEKLSDTLELFWKLNNKTQAPFAAYYQLDNKYLLCASPERFLKKQGQKIISQPIKGTISRGRDPEQDERNKARLRNSVKDQAENVMIVDLVRNDLAKSCLPGSVQVEELFGLLTVPTVHQMVSTVTGQLRPDIDSVHAIRNAFPMGSMTGAPKVVSMEIIEELENTKRGLFSGTVGYIDPAGDFDFNVVIRSILYNGNAPYISLQTGGAIVYDSIPEQEYEESLLKANALRSLLKGQ